MSSNNLWGKFSESTLEYLNINLSNIKMNSQFFNNNQIIQKSFNSDVLEGNWYEDRCTTQYDKNKKRDYLLPNPNAWQYQTSSGEFGQNWKGFPKIKQRFSESNDNFINFQNKNTEMYVTTTKHTYDPNYRETFRQPPTFPDFYKNKQAELSNYRASWTKRRQNFDTSYKSDILSKAGSTMLPKKEKVV